MGSIIAGLIRHGLTAAGGGLLTEGVATADDINTITGAVLAIGGVIWSVFSKYRAKK